MIRFFLNGDNGIVNSMKVAMNLKKNSKPWIGE